MNIDLDDSYKYYMTNINNTLYTVYNYNVLITVVLCVLGITTKLHDNIGTQTHRIINVLCTSIITFSIIYSFNIICISKLKRNAKITCFVIIVSILFYYSKISCIVFLIFSAILYLHVTHADNYRSHAIIRELNEICYG